MGTKRCLAVVAAALFALACTAGSAFAYSTNGASVTTYESGFPSASSGIGPIGITVDPSNTLYVVDTANEYLYRFTGPSQNLGFAAVHQLANAPKGLAWDANGLYVAGANGSIEQLNPSTGTTVRTIVSGVGCLQGLAADPSNSDLYATDVCDKSIIRVTGVASGTPSVSAVASGLTDPDGIVVAQDGTIFFVDSGAIVRMNGSSSAAPFQRSAIASVPSADGIAVGGGATPTFLLVNRNDGVISRVDIGGGTTDIVSGGSRGDFVAVGVDGCLYATQSDSVLRVSGPNGSCNTGALSGPGGGLTPSPPVHNVPPGKIGLPTRKGCIDRRGFRFTLHHVGNGRVVQVDVYINGRHVKRVRGHNLTHLRLTRLPKRKFVVRIVALESNGFAIISTRTYRGCRKSKPHSVTKHHH